MCFVVRHVDNLQSEVGESILHMSLVLERNVSRKAIQGSCVSAESFSP